MTIRRDFLVTELMIYPYPSMRKAVCILSAGSESLSTEELHQITLLVDAAVNEHSSEADPHLALKNIQALIKRCL